MIYIIFFPPVQKTQRPRLWVRDHSKKEWDDDDDDFLPLQLPEKLDEKNTSNSLGHWPTNCRTLPALGDTKNPKKKPKKKLQKLDGRGTDNNFFNEPHEVKLFG